MDMSEDIVLFLQDLPYFIQTRFLKILPYFLQIELAQTNHYFSNLYKSLCFKRKFTDNVIIGIEKDGIQINDKRYSASLFEYEKSMRVVLHKLDDFPTKLLYITNPGKTTAINIRNLVKELMPNGVYFTNMKEEKLSEEYLLGWDTVSTGNGTRSAEKNLTYYIASLNGTRSSERWTNLSSDIESKGKKNLNDK